MDLTAIIAAVAGLIGGGGLVAAGKTWLDHTRSMTQDGNTVSLTLIDRLQARVTSLELQHTECQQREAALSTKVGILTERCDDQQRQIAHLTEIVHRLEGISAIAHINADPLGIIIYWDVGATTLFLWTADEAIGKNVDILIPAYLKEKHHERFDAASSSEDNSRPLAINAFAVDKHGNEFPVSIIVNKTIVDGRKILKAEVKRRGLL